MSGLRVRLLVHIDFGHWHINEVYEIVGGTEDRPVIQDGDDRIQLLPYEYEVIDEDSTD